MLKVQLIVVQGKPEGKSIPLTGPVFRVGRGESCHLRPNSELVSREHTEITIADEAVIVRDLGSRNGTFVNGKQLKQPHTLRNGELLQIGPLTFAVSIQGAPAAAAAQGRSLDEVPPDQIDSWLVADQANNPPDRPSGIYSGDTLTINAYNEAVAAKDSAEVSTQAPAPKVPAAAAPKPAAPAPKPAAPAPRPAAPAPVQATTAPAAPTAPAPAKAAPAKPAAKPAPAPAAARTDDEGAGRSNYLDNVEFDSLPEGDGDSPPASAGAASDDADSDGMDGADSEGMPEEMMDESNPFYLAKKQSDQEQTVGSSKPQFKDSSDAASDILRRMMDRRRSAR